MKYINLKASVGAGASNDPDDVLNLQKALNQLAEKTGLSQPLAEDGKISDNPEHSPTCQAIGQMQKILAGFQHPDMRVDCNSHTHQTLDNALKPQVSYAEMFETGIQPETGLTDDDFQAAAEVLQCEIAAIKAVSEVESSSHGFLDNALPTILYEAHQFSRLTQHRYDNSHPNISSYHWNRSLYLGGIKEYIRLKQAMTLDSTAALKSASYGRYQLMGFNHQAAGYEDVESFVHSMVASERNHLMGFVHFIKSNPNMHLAIQKKDWPAFASLYNGPGYKENHYDQRLESTYSKIAK